ncbi:MAG TPA: cation:proton antiporter, partial [Spirochaetia bacterium]|nr:cation:proton antiporter [Spirochaetia bacterium]
TVLVAALGIAYASSRFFGVSMALGAFLAGVVVGRSDFSLRAATEALPMRDAFAVLFFVSVGMRFDPRSLAAAPWLALATTGIVIVAKPLVSGVMVRLLGQPRRAALSVGLALGQIGEFSFILAAMGTALGLLPEKATSALVMAAIVSIGVNPLLRRLLGPTDGRARRRPPAPDWERRDDGRAHSVPSSDARAGAPPDPRHRAVVVGYGPVGRTLVRLLTENGVTCTIIEMNLQTVHRLRSQGLAAVYGDAAHAETLRQAGAGVAGTLLLSASGLPAREVMRQARDINPGIRILVRTSYLRERDALREAGADLVFSGEGEVALAMNDAILRDLGAPASRIARERKKLQTEL